MNAKFSSELSRAESFLVGFFFLKQAAAAALFGLCKFGSALTTTTMRYLIYYTTAALHSGEERWGLKFKESCHSVGEGGRRRQCREAWREIWHLLLAAEGRAAKATSRSFLYMSPSPFLFSGRGWMTWDPPTLELDQCARKKIPGRSFSLPFSASQGHHQPSKERQTEEGDLKGTRTTKEPPLPSGRTRVSDSPFSPTSRFSFRSSG